MAECLIYWKPLPLNPSHLSSLTSPWLEHLDDQDHPRPGWTAVHTFLNAASYAELDHLDRLLQGRIEQLHTTYLPVGDTNHDAASPWRLDPIPLIIAENDWRHIEAGITQRATLLEALLRDTYGPQRCLADGLLDEDCIYDNPGFLRAAHGWQPGSGQRLMSYAADLVRGPDGHWRVTADLCQYPHGAGYAVENRLVMARALSDTFRNSGVRRLSSFFEAMQQGCKQLCPGDAPRVVLLAPSNNDHAIDQACLARYLGYEMVEGRDLMVRGGQLTLKTLGGLQPIDVLLRHVDDAASDPLHGAVDGGGPAGLLRCAAEGGVVVANALGNAWAEDPRVAEYLPRCCPALLDQDLLLAQAPHDIPHSHAPSWQHGHLALQPLTLRVFALYHQGQWQVMPGGFARTGDHQGGSKDVWVTSQGPAPQQQAPLSFSEPLHLRRGGIDVPSLLLDDLYWLGRYVERAETLARVSRCVFDLYGDQRSEGVEAACHSCYGILVALGAVNNHPEAFTDHSISAALHDEHCSGSLPHILRATNTVSARVRSRLSRDAWRACHELCQFSHGITLHEHRPITSALNICDTVIDRCAALAGAFSENTVRGHTWAFLDLGRRIERARNTILILQATAPPLATSAHLEAALDIADCLLTYRARYRGRLFPAAVIDLLLCDESNPRSLHYQVQAARAHLASLPKKEQQIGPHPAESTIIALDANLSICDLPQLCSQQGEELYPFLQDIYQQLGLASDQIAHTWFEHALPHRADEHRSWMVVDERSP
ncbi:MAG: hypothetical protein EA401_14545 [Planctomycetota bacterium]|nr:MAG: hypothetical protein EA401_14545 [Planctomycetota bacterium]